MVGQKMDFKTCVTLSASDNLLKELSTKYEGSYINRLRTSKE